MSLRLRIGVAALAATMATAGVAGFVGQASSHPRVENSAAAACAGCHMTDYRGARHHMGEKPTTCGVCHSQGGWHPTHLDHDAWPLTGAHAKAKCFACHTGEPPAFHATDKACVACHRPEYERAPNHVARGFATTCEECHSTEAWKPTLPHHAQSVPTLAPPPPAPPPAVIATARPKTTTIATATAHPTASPRPTATAKPKPTVAPTTTKPDTVTGASRR